MGASQVGEDRVRTTKRRERASVAFGLCGANGQEIDLLSHKHSEERIQKPKTGGCQETARRVNAVNTLHYGNQNLSIRKRQNGLRTGSCFTLEKFGLFIQIFYCDYN